MALVNHIEQIDKERQSVHTPTECTASVVRAGGQYYLQLDTYGSAERQDKGKISQSIQFSEAAAAQLKRLIDETFPNLR